MSIISHFNGIAFLLIVYQYVGGNCDKSAIESCIFQVILLQ